MFSKILIANRGEIACRIIRTARRMGITTVAVYSEVDARALHVRLADEAVLIGAAPATDSYLSIEKIIAACKVTGAEAVHPGYGFLSERALFARRLAEEGITFIGPNPHAIEAMGDKIESKRAAVQAGVSTVPGHVGVIDTPEEAERIAAGIGYPVMIKASAGGGGKGMRIARSPEEVREGFARAKSEAAASFGDDRVFVEKFIENPRHIEIQIIADKHGNCVYLGERECSIQRRNQKVLEEAPSPLLNPETRARMGAESVALARAVGYDSAGTVEFVVGQDRSFYFLEMNTRLQVEHPVTELITGQDLVELMIRSAAGEPLPLAQEDVRLTGWAVESRIYAEDPERGFMPSTGRLTTYRPPAEGVVAGVTTRNDTGVFEGGEIPVHYDPMIAKLVTHAPTRAEAIAAQAEALDAFAIGGIRHNIPFLSSLMRHSRWREGRLSTGFLTEEYPQGYSPAGSEGDRRLAALIAAAATHRREPDVALPRALVLRSAEAALEVTLNVESGGVLRIDGLGAPAVVVSDWLPGQAIWRGQIDGLPVTAALERQGESWTLSRGGAVTRLRVLDALADRLIETMPVPDQREEERQLRSPAAAQLSALLVAEGDQVGAGQRLAVIEAMKMESPLLAPVAGRVARIMAQPGALLAAGQVILELD